MAKLKQIEVVLYIPSTQFSVSYYFHPFSQPKYYKLNGMWNDTKPTYQVKLYHLQEQSVIKSSVPHSIFGL